MLNPPPDDPVEHRQTNVTIIVIAFNEAGRIKDCLTALAAQTYDGRYDIIVVDDGSTDQTSELARQFQQTVAKTHQRTLTVITLPTNQGRGHARATGIGHAQGQHIAFVDADITVPSDWLTRAMQHLPGHAAVSGTAVPDGDVAVLHRIFQATPRTVPGTAVITGNNVLFDGTVLRNIGFDPTARLGEDFRLSHELRRQGHKVATVPELTVQHRERKTYRKAIRWLYESGVDATTLLTQYRHIRTPDITFATWAAATLTTTLVAVTQRNKTWLLTAPTLTALIAAAHTITRFNPRPHPGRFIATTVGNIPLIGAYLIGRTIGATKHMVSKRR